MKQLPAVQTRTDYAKLGGGVDQVSPALSIKPGYAISAINYEPEVFGGYRRIDGFERFDGRAAPSAATYLYTTANITGVVAAGNAVTGVTSGATAVVAVVGAGVLALTKAVGTFVAGEVLNVSSAPVATLTMAPLLRGYPDGYGDAVALNAAADQYRADIAAVPGSGAIRGVWMYKGVAYAFRDNVGATACVLHKSTVAGWVAVDLGYEVAFSNANVSVGEGDTLTQGGVTAVIKRIALHTGTLASGTNTGRLILSTLAGGNFAAGAATSTGGGSITLGGAQTAITQLPGGRYEFCNYNFAGSTDTFRVYGCDGVNRAFEFDGATFAPITTGMAEDKPTYICAHRNMLFLSFRASLQNSGVAEPFKWTTVTGASEIGMGDDITGMLTQPGEVLAVFSRNSTRQLLGASRAEFKLDVLAPEVGAIGRTVQNVGMAYALDDRGITQITRTQAYGNFNSGTVSRLAQPLIDALRSKVVASAVYRARNQYRLFANDGTGVILTVEGDKVVGITSLSYPITVSCACSGEDSTGKDIVLLGAANGFVYQADKGSSFDGEEIEAFLRPVFNNSRSPRERKRYRKAVLEMAAVAYSSIRVQPEFSYGDESIASHTLQTAEVQGGGGYYDFDNYETIYYDGRVVQSPEFPINGTGTNIAINFYSKTDIDLGHTLQGVLLHYTPRRLAR
ncbi:MAG TPA: hypothetical protein VIT92_07145 [Burkholderiaceae bacterium]